MACLGERERAMFDPRYLLAAAVVLLLWVIAAAIIREVGPGRVHRTVRCPHETKKARLVVLFTEPVWGTLKPTDILACSEFPSGAVTCDKACLARL
jgi:hypothetical protein